MAYDITKKATLGHLKNLGTRVNAELTPIKASIKALEDVGAQANVLEAVKVNGTAQAITDKAVDIAVPVNVSQLANDSKYQTEEQVAAAIAAVDHLQRKKVASKDDIDPTAADADKYIYMVPKTGGKNGDKYDEYMVLDGAIEPVGDWAVDLSGYIREEDVATDSEITEMLDGVFGAA